MGKQNKPKRDAQHLQEQDGLPLVLFVSLRVCELALACLPVLSLSLLPLTVDNPRCYSSPAAARGKEQLLDLGQETNGSKLQCPSSALHAGHGLFIDSF